jgi:hypothetical protein
MIGTLEGLWFSKNWIQGRERREATQGGTKCRLEEEFDSFPYRSA